MQSNRGGRLVLHVGGYRHVGEERGGPPRVVPVDDETPDEAGEAERDVYGGEAEHETADPEDVWGDGAGTLAEAGDVEVGGEETDVAACIKRER